jgi:hypothetical protein
VRPYLEKSFMKIGLVEWFKVKALSSSPSTKRKRERGKKKKSKENDGEEQVKH